MPLFSQIMAFTLQTYTIFGKFHLIKTTHINLAQRKFLVGKF